MYLSQITTYKVDNHDSLQLFFFTDHQRNDDDQKSFLTRPAKQKISIMH